MTRKKALEELIAKVEAGGATNDGSMFRAFSDKWTICYDAFHGSLDAAMALHEAVLPGWPYTIENVTGLTFRAWTDKSRNLRQMGFSARSETPARAWLLAILKALHAQETE